MRLRNVPGAREDLADFEREFDWDSLKDKPVKWGDVFGNTDPIMIEIGMGKGGFLTRLAMCSKGTNLIGIEKFSSVLIRAVQKIEQLENAGEDLSNIRLIRMDAENIDKDIREKEIDRIYLNFSDPWPKDRHAKRRLTSRQFLGRYQRILKDGGDIIFKTDNKDLFDFSLEEAKASGWELLHITYDLGDSDPSNIMTEYEERFRSINKPICRMIIKKPSD